MNREFSIAFIVFLMAFAVEAQESGKEFYRKAFTEQQQMLIGEIPLDFKRAVFISENSYHQGKLNYDVFKNHIEEIGRKLQKFILDSEMSSYKTAVNWAVFTFMTEELEINNNSIYSYDFDDYFGEKDISKMFVSKLMNTKSGNCHSLPYLYKILCDEMEANAHLAIAPNHIFIKHISESGRWTNVELTSASFPDDKWMAKEMGIPKNAIANKIYLQPLTDKESIALTVFDLSNNYESQFGMDSFYLNIIDSALRYFPCCIPLLMNKANYYEEKIYLEQTKQFVNREVLTELQNMHELVNQKIKELGHQEMSTKLYEKWLRYTEKEKKKLEKKKKTT
jgi:hypothetical protein